MNKACASILIFVALFILVGAQDFKRLPLEQGGLRMRSLATASTPKYNLNNFTTNFAVRVDLGPTYLASIGLSNKDQTYMTVFLSTNVTGFCEDCAHFVKFGCSNNNCSYDSSRSQSMTSPGYSVKKGYPFNFNNLAIGSDSSNSGWKLKTSAFYYSSDSATNSGIHSAARSRRYIKNYTTYGYIGLGIGGEASKNFQTARPIFSLKIDPSGSGSLIFGKDSSLFDSKRAPITLTTDTNWTVTSRNMSFGPYYNNFEFNSRVIFDLQNPGISFTRSYLLDFSDLLAQKYNITYNYNLGNNFDVQCYTGALSNLPNLTIGLGNGKNLTLPPSAYTRELAPDFYALLLHALDDVTDENGQRVNYTVIGWSALSQFYTVFELASSGVPTVTMYPTYNASANGVSENLVSEDSNSSSSSSFKTPAIIAGVVLVILVALSAICMKKKNESIKSDLGIELRSAKA